MFETKVHYKLYKAGKKWLAAAIGVTTLGIGLSQATNVSASDTDTTTAKDESASVTTQSTTAKKVVALKAQAATKQTTTTDGDSNDAAKTNSESNSTQTQTSDATNVNGHDATDTQDATNDGNSSNPTDSIGTSDQSNEDNESTTPDQTDESTTETPTTDVTDPSDTNTKTNAVAPKAEDATVIPTASAPLYTDTTYDPDKAVTTEPAILNNASGHDEPTTETVDAHVRLTATDAQGNTSTSLTDNNGLGNNQAASIIDVNAKNLSAIFGLTNTTKSSQYANILFTLPSYLDELANHQVQVTLTDGAASNAALLADLPAGMTLTYIVKGGVFSTNYTYQQLVAAGYDLSDVSEIHIQGPLAIGGSYVAKVPLTLTNPIVDGTNLEDFQVYNCAISYTNPRTLYIRIGQPDPDKIVGQYVAVTGQANQPSHDVVPQDIQDLMPDVEAGDLIIHNFGYDETHSSGMLYTGGRVFVNIKKMNIANLVKDHGYSVLLNQDGTPQDTYVYFDAAKDTIINYDPASSDATAQTSAPYVYVILRKVITTQDSSLTVNQQWNKADNFVSGLADDDSALSLDQVQVSVDDPDNVLQDGKAVKAGTFKVTYAYQLANDYYDTGNPYIVSETATVTVTDPNQGSTTGGNSGTTAGGSTSGGDTTPTDDNSGTTTGDSGDTITTGGDGDTITPGNTDTSTAPVITTGGDGDEIVTGSAGDKATTAPAKSQPTMKKSSTTQLKTGGDGDQIITSRQGQATNAHGSATAIAKGHSTATTTGATAATPATVKAAQPTALAHATTKLNTATTANAQQPVKQARKTTNAATTALPQTNDANVLNLIAAGAALLLGALGVAADRRKQH